MCEVKKMGFNQDIRKRGIPFSRLKNMSKKEIKVMMRKYKLKTRGFKL